MQLVAEGLGRTVLEKAVGFKYIAAEMLASEVLLGGEESGGVGFGGHLPERDALYAALLLIEALVEGGGEGGFGVRHAVNLSGIGGAGGAGAAFPRPIRLRAPVFAAIPAIAAGGESRFPPWLRRAA